MALVKVYATKARFEKCAGYWMMSISITFDGSQDLPGTIVKEYTKAADIEADMRALHEKLKADFPDQGHYVSTYIRRTDRKPNGYNKLPKMDYNPERDRQAQPEQIAA